MNEINEILNMLYYVDEDINNIIINQEQSISKLKRVLKKLEYAYKKIEKLDNCKE